MKKIYLTAAMSAMLMVANAQQSSKLVNKHDGNPRSELKPIKPSNNFEKAIPIWSNTFNNPSDWVMTNTSQPIPWDWVITTNQGAIPNAAPSLQPFMSTTANDGFALIDSDGQPGNVDGDGAIIAEITNAIPIDLSLYPNVVLQYQHSYRWWQDTRGVRVSGDGGLTWTDYEVTNLSGYPNDQNSENPTIETINISAVAGGSNNVLVQFYYNDNDFWGWYWVVDDVQILEQPDNDIQLLSAWFAGQNNEGVEYGRTPTNHLESNHLVGGQVFNFGVNTQTNVVLNSDYTVFNYSSNTAALLSGDTVILESTETPSLPVGIYNGTYTVTSTEETAGTAFGNNVYLRSFEVTTDMYSVDGIGVYPASIEDHNVIGTNSFNGSDDGMYVAALYSLKQSDMVSGIRVMLHSSTQPGGDIYGSILDTAAFLADNIVSLYNTNGATVSAQDVSNGYIDLLFPTVVTIPAGGYFAAVSLYSNGGTSPIAIIDDQTVAQPFYASMIYIDGDATYSNGTGIGIRLLTGDNWGVGLEESEMAGVSVYPNPSTGVINITNDNGYENTIIVRDINGRVVSTTKSGVATTVDLSGMGAGVYTVVVKNEKGNFTDRIVIK